MTLLELFGIIKHHLKMVIVVPLVAAIAAASVCWVVLPDEYSASVSVYVLARSSAEDATTISNNELTASQMLTNDVVALIKSDRVMDDAAEALGWESLDGFDVTINSSSSTRVITIVVTGGSPQEVADVANQLAKTVDAVAREVIEVKSVNMIDQASVPTSPSGPPRVLYTLIALLAGLLAAVAIAILVDLADTRVRSAEEASELLGLPVIGRIPVIKK